MDTGSSGWRAMLAMAVGAAREVLAAAPEEATPPRGPGDFKRCDAEILVARMVFSELGMTPLQEQRAEPGKIAASAKEVVELATKAQRGALRHGDRRVASLAAQLVQAVSQSASRS